MRHMHADIVLICIDSYLVGNLSVFAETETLAKRVLAFMEGKYGNDHENVVFAIRMLSMLYYPFRRDKATARELLTRALMITERVYGKNHHEVASVLLSLGDTYRDGNMKD